MQHAAFKVAVFLQRHPIFFILLLVALVAGAVPGVTSITTSTGFDTFVSSRSQTYQDYERYKDEFGKEPILILIKGNEEIIISRANLQLMVELEKEVDEDSRFIGMMSPATFLAPLLSLPPQEYSAALRGVLYTSEGGINPELSGVVPKPGNVLIHVIPSGEITPEEVIEAQREIEDRLGELTASGMESFVSSDAEVLQALSQEIGQSMALLLGLAIIVMFLILALLFRVRWRLLSLFMVLVATLWAFGLMGYAGISLSMATMAVIPILIGLGIDYSLQFHSRYQEELRRQNSVPAAIIHSMSSISPGVGIAFGATAIGFLTLLMSRVPMVRDFGIILTLGIFLSYLVALFLLNAILARRDRKARLEELKAESAEASHREERVLGAIARYLIGHPIPILVLAAAVFLAGAILDHRLGVMTEWERLMPQDITALEELREVRKVVGYSGELRFMIEGQDVLQPETLHWMQDYADQEMALHPELHSVASPSVLVIAYTGGGIPDDSAEIERILASMPAVIRQSVVNQEGTVALVTFPLEQLSLKEVNDLLLTMEEDIEAPPNTSVVPTGAYMMGTKIMDAVVGARLPMILAGVGGVFLGLFIIYRRWHRVIFALIPMALVIGWSSAAMYAFDIAINPLTAIMSAIIVGIGTEFAVLLLERYHEEKGKGLAPRQAMVTACSSLGRAIVTSAITTLGGFACLIGSDFIMIRDFGVVTVIDVFFCLVSVMVVLPPLVVWFDDWRLRRLQPAAESILENDVVTEIRVSTYSTEADEEVTTSALIAPKSNGETRKPAKTEQTNEQGGRIRQ